MNDEELAALTPHLLDIHRYPNLYTMTKGIAEKLVQNERGHLPVCIVRPSIVTPTQAEPFPVRTEGKPC
jgi:fatty acyl-CoA reductase